MVAPLVLAPEPTSDLSSHALVGATREHLVETLAQMRALMRRRDRSAEEEERLEWLRFWTLRIGTRLHVLGDGGLMALGAVVEREPPALVGDAILELAAEFDRRAIVTAVVIGGEAGALWIDADQVFECLRCALDEALSRSQPHGRIVVNVGMNDGDLEFAVAHNGWDGWGDGLNVALMRGLAARMGGTVTMATEGTPAWHRIVLRIPPSEAPAHLSRESDVREIGVRTRIPLESVS